MVTYAQTCFLSSINKVAPTKPSEPPPHRKVTREKNQTGPGAIKTYLYTLLKSFFHFVRYFWDLLTLGWTTTLRCRNDTDTGLMLDSNWEKWAVILPDRPTGTLRRALWKLGQNFTFLIFFFSLFTFEFKCIYLVLSYLINKFQRKDQQNR